MYDETKIEEKKKLWARARCGNIWRGQESRGGEMCRGCGQEKENGQHAENYNEFERRTGIKMERWWRGLNGRIEEGLLEIIKKIDEEQRDEGREDRQRRDDRERREEEDQKPDKRTGFKLFIDCKFILYTQMNYVLL